MTGAEGLTSADAARLPTEHGPNELLQARGPSPLRILAGQFSGAMIWLLLGACVLSAALGELLDASAIAVIVVLNAVPVTLVETYELLRRARHLKLPQVPT